jgi:hypothetical protein
MFIGDMVGCNEMIGQYQSHTANCLWKDCKCTQDELLQFPLQSEPITWADLQECEIVEEIFALYHKKGLISEDDMSKIHTDPAYAKESSKHPIKNAFDALPLADPYQGITGMTPQEMLHLMGSGMIKYLIHSIKDVIGERGTNSKVKGLINDIFHDVKLYIHRNLDRDTPRMSNRNGFFNVTSLTNDEVRGNFLGLVVLMHMSYGDDLLRLYFEYEGICYEDMLETCSLVLSWERFHSDPQKRSDLKNSRFATRDLMQRIIRDVPRPEKPRVGSFLGSKGWRIAKFHALAFIEHWTQKLGKIQVL